MKLVSYFAVSSMVNAQYNPTTIGPTVYEPTTIPDRSTWRPPTEPPTEPPTMEPTDPPTEPPTEPPTALPTLIVDAGLSCWHCDASDIFSCLQTGQSKTCLDNEQSCQVEIRKRDGRDEKITMGCKAIDACKINKMQNFSEKAKRGQCRPKSNKGPSVCRQCCNTQNCDLELGEYPPNNLAGWREELM